MNEAAKPKTKQCGCGRVYELDGNWSQLPDRTIYDDHDGSLCEQRKCVGCESHITIQLIPAATLDEMRRAVHALGWMNESFSSEYTAPELLRLMKVCWASPWDLFPDQWTQQQCSAALTEGRAPQFEERATGLHALEVGDCGCKACG